MLKFMLKFASLAVLALVPAAPLAAQATSEQAAPALIRESLYQVNFAEMDAWNRAFATHVRPVLEALREEGAIQGWSTWSHDTGGAPYNWRLAIRFHEGAHVNAIIGDFVARVEASAGSEAAEVQRLILRHEDQIWSIRDASFRDPADPAEGSAPRFYVASFQVNPADLEAWNAFYEATWKPALQAATAAGTLNGWAVLGHAHGGPYNWRIMLFAPGWDSLDDAWEGFFRAFGQDEDAWMKVLRMIEAHDDAIWAPAGSDG